MKHAPQFSEEISKLVHRRFVSQAEQAAFGARKLRNFDSTLPPAILLLQGKRAVVLHRVAREGELVIHDPVLGEGLGEIARDEMERHYTGYAILLRPEHREDIIAAF